MSSLLVVMNLRLVVENFMKVTIPRVQWQFTSI